MRSPHAHARITGIDARRALVLPGVVAALTTADLPECDAAVPPLVPSPRLRPYAEPAIAGAKARHAGEAVAVVVADDVYRATDVAQAVDVRYDVLPAAATVDPALSTGAPRVFDEWPDNAAGPSDGAVGAVVRGFGEAHVIVGARLGVPRVAAMPIEPRGVLVQPEGAGRPADDLDLDPGAVRRARGGRHGPGPRREASARDRAGRRRRLRRQGPRVSRDVLLAAVARRLRRPVK